MIEYYIDYWKNCFDFQGRARRSAYWSVWLVNIIIITILSVLKSLIPVLTLLYGLFGIATLIPHISLSIRRLHDTGRSGAWLLMGLLPPVIIWLFTTFGGYSAVSFVGNHLILVLLVSLIPVITLIAFFCQDSDSQNYYGPSPKYNHEAPPENAYAASPQSGSASGSSFYKPIGKQVPQPIFRDEGGAAPTPVGSFYKKPVDGPQSQPIFHDEDGVAPTPVGSFYKKPVDGAQSQPIFHDEDAIAPTPAGSFYKKPADESQSQPIFHDEES